MFRGQRNKHQRDTGASRLRAAKSNKAVLCSRVMSNHIRDLLYAGPHFGVLEDGGNRHPRAGEDPGTAHVSEHALDRRTL